MEWEQKAQELRSRCPEAVVQFESGEACVAEVQVREGEMELAMRRISVARESWNRRVAGQGRQYGSVAWPNTRCKMGEAFRE